MKSCRVFSLSLQVECWPEQYSRSENVVGKAATVTASSGFVQPSDTPTLAHPSITQDEPGLGRGHT